MTWIRARKWASGCADVEADIQNTQIQMWCAYTLFLGHMNCHLCVPVVPSHRGPRPIHSSPHDCITALTSILGPQLQLRTFVTGDADDKYAALSSICQPTR